MKGRFSLTISSPLWQLQRTLHSTSLKEHSTHDSKVLFLLYNFKNRTRGTLQNNLQQKNNNTRQISGNFAEGSQ